MATESLDNLKQSFLRLRPCEVSEPFIEPAKDITHAQLKSFMIPIFAEYNHQELHLLPKDSNESPSHQINKKHALHAVFLDCASSKKAKKNDETAVKIDKDSVKSNAVCNSKNFSRIMSTEMKKNSPKLSPSPSPQGSPVRAGSPINITTVVATSTAHPSQPCNESPKKKKRKEMDIPTTFESIKNAKSSDNLISCSVAFQDKICLRVCGLSKGKYDPKFELYSFHATSTIDDLITVIEKSRCNENEKIAMVVRTVWINDMMVPKKIEPSTLLINDSHNSTWELHLKAHHIILNRIA